MDKKEEERNNIETDFFRKLLKDRIEFQISKDETKDIIDGIDILLQIIIIKVSSNVDLFGSFSRLVKVGSIAEKTSICFPDEFDYLLVSEQSDIDVERVCEWRKAYVHAKIKDNGLKEKWGKFLSGNYLRGSFTRDFFRVKLYDMAQYVISVGRKWLRSNHLVDDTSRINSTETYYDCLQNAFMVEVNKVIKEDYEDLIHQTSSGTLRVKKYVTNHGPAVMAKFTWNPDNRDEKHDITVDIALALKLNLSQENPIIHKNDTFHEKIWDALEKNGTFLVIPCQETASCPAGLCFRLTFTETEVEIVKSLSPHHRECYMLLKYVFNGGRGVSFIPSYALKILVIKHDCFCDETENLARCFKTLVASLLHCVLNKETIDTFELSSLMRMFIPGEKSKPKISSIFVKEHNILDTKDYIIPFEQFLFECEEMLKSLRKIGEEPNTNIDALKLVNDRDTAAIAYGKSMVPFRIRLKGDDVIRHCLDLVDEYFIPLEEDVENVT